jgi:hypothetical protein
MTSNWFALALLGVAVTTLAASRFFLGFLHIPPLNFFKKETIKDNQKLSHAFLSNNLSPFSSAQFNKNKAVGPCINGKCPEGHVCHQQECFPAPPRRQQNDDPLASLFDETPQRM